MRVATRRVLRRCWLGVLVAGALAAAAELKAQPAPGEEPVVLAAETMLGNAMRSGDKSAARRLLSLQFSYVDETGKVHERKEFLNGLKEVAAAAGDDAEVRIYGRVAMVTGHRKSALDSDVFFLDIWAKQKGSWRALVAQDVALDLGLAAPGAAVGAPAAPITEAAPYDCKNPCQTIPYRVRSPAEQDIVNAFQAIERASVAHNAEEWSKHVADEFVLYGSGRAPIPKSGRIAVIKRQNDSGAVVKVGEVETMRLAVYEDGAAMIATHVPPDNSRPPYQAARVWVRRNGQWLMAISVQTDVK